MGRGGISSEEGAVAGGVMGAGLAICFCVIGIPTILTAIIMLAVADTGSGVWTVGLILLLISLLVLVGGIVIIIVLCTGCCGKAQERQRVHPQHIQVTAVAVPPPTVQPVQPPSYGMASHPPPQYPQPAGYSHHGGAAHPSGGYSHHGGAAHPSGGYTHHGGAAQPSGGYSHHSGAAPPQPGSSQFSDPAYPPPMSYNSGMPPPNEKPPAYY